MTSDERQVPDAELKHLGATYIAVPGKLAWDCPVLHRKPQLAAKIERGLVHAPGVTSGKANFWTGRIHVDYEPDALRGFDNVEFLLARCVDQIVNVCVESYVAERPTGAPELEPNPADNPQAVTASALRLSRELAQLLYEEANAALHHAAQSPPEQQPSVLRLWLQMRGLLRPVAPAPAEAAATDAEPSEPEIEGTEPGEATSEADEPTTSARAGDSSIYANMPSLEPIVASLARWIVSRYGEDRIAQLLEASRTGSPTAVLEGLLSSLAAEQSAEPTRPRRRGFIGGLIDRIEDVESRLREARAAAPSSSNPTAEPTPGEAAPPSESPDP